VNVTYYVRANYHDYEHGSGQLIRSCRTIELARALRDTIASHIAFAGPKGTAHPSLRGPLQEEGESDEAFETRERTWDTRVERHRDESLDWFPSGHGYFTSAPVIVKRVWSEEVVK
jgi:hypothetical protein